MTRFLPAVLFLLLTQLSAIPAGAWGPPPIDRVWIKTRTQSFNKDYYVAVHEGRVWIKRVDSAAYRGGGWRMLEDDGLPRKHRWYHFFYKAPTRIRELSADGNNLILIQDDDGREDEGKVYYGHFSDWLWENEWGMPFDAVLRLTRQNRAWAISHRGKDNEYYEDIDGNPHPVWAGVTTLYQLEGDGKTISFADPWTPPVFEHRICGPERNTFIAENMSASASTLFVINKGGRMYTRLADYDTLGMNPILPYSWKRGYRGGATNAPRVLPGEDWRPQPPVPGRPTRNITILQTGKGNAARELRVEGMHRDGRIGFFYKGIYEQVSGTLDEDGVPEQGWHFKRLRDHRIEEPFLTEREEWGPSIDFTYQGAWEAGDLRRRNDLPARLLNFNLYCTPATIRLRVGFEEIELVLHTIENSKHDLDQAPAEIKGAILIPPGLYQHWNRDIVRWVYDRFGRNRDHVKVEVTVSKDSVQIVSTDPVSLDMRFTRQ